MKNNQFKKVIRNKIDAYCLAHKLQAVYVDHSNNDRTCYIFTEDFLIKGTISCWLNDTTIHLRASRSHAKVVGINNYDIDRTCTYMEFNKICMTLNSFIGSLVPQKVEATSCQ